MPDLRIAFFLSHEQFAPTQLLEFAVAAAEAGFDQLATSDHFHPWQDNQGHAAQAWVTLSAIGQLVSTIPFGTAVTCPTYRYQPAIVAQAFASLAVLYPGRVFLGVESGEAVNEQSVTGQFGDFEERLGRLSSAVELIQKLWSGDWISHRDEYFQAANLKLYDPPAQPIPLLIAGSGKRSVTLAGERGNGWITDAKTLLKQEMVQTFRQAYGKSHGSVDSSRIMVEQFTVVGGQREAQEAADLWQFQQIGFTDLLTDPDPRSIQKRAAARLSLDDVASGFLVSENAEDHVNRIRQLADAGATDVVVHTGQHDQLRAIRFYEREVLPLLSRAGESARITEKRWAGRRPSGTTLDRRHEARRRTMTARIKAAIWHERPLARTLRPL